MEGSEKVLIVKLSSIGDVVHTVPFLDVLKLNYPGLTVDWCVEDRTCEIIKGNPFLDRIIVFHRDNWKKNLFSIKELRKREYDLIIDLQGLLKSGLIVGISKGKRKIGLSGAREFGWLFVDEIVSVNYNQHAIDRYIQVAKYLGCKSLNWKWRIAITESDKEKVKRIINKINREMLPIVAINPVARWKSKLWKEKNFSELAKRLIKEGIRPVFLASKKEKLTVERIINGIKGAVNLSGVFNLRQLYYFYSNCLATVTLDTGPMHIAAASGCKVIALFGPTDPLRTGPYGNGHKVIKIDLPCSPCFKKRCHEKRCMNEITVDMVMKEIFLLLN